jgi:hypothetical protein
MAGLLVVMLATGCTAAVGGKARPAPGLTPRPLTGQTIKQLLVDDAALSKILKQSFAAKSDLPPRFGGPEKLLQAFGAVSPADCVGVTTMTDKNTYQSANVKNVARATWWNAAGPAKVISVTEGVVALPTAAEAAALFQKFSQQWDKCDGTTVTIQGGRISFSDKVTDVRVADSVLAATVFVETRLDGSSSVPRPEARAIGIRVNCLVEVEVAFFSTQGPADQGSGDPKTSAIDIARTMMDKVSELA